MYYQLQQDKKNSIKNEANNSHVCGRCAYWLGDSNDGTKFGKCTRPEPTKKNPVTQKSELFDGKTLRSFSCRTQFEENKNIEFDNGTYYFKNLIK